MREIIRIIITLFLASVLSVSCAKKEAGQTGQTSQDQTVQNQLAQDQSVQDQFAQDQSAQGQTARKQEPQDGTYEPASFRAEGGSGRVRITCEEVSVSNGATEAVIVFSSPHYEWVKKDGVTYEPENAGAKERETSVFRIPVLLDEEQVISGLTTAMSQPHEIEYTIFVSLTQKEEAIGAGKNDLKVSDRDESIKADQNGKPVLPGLQFLAVKKLDYAETFDIYAYALQDTAGGTAAEKATENGNTDKSGDKIDNVYHLIDVHNSGVYLLVPEGGAVPEGLPEEITVLRKPLQNLYVAATSSMALFDAAGALDIVKLTGTDVKGWYIDAPKKALESGTMRYAGKYSSPDYELLASSGCDLAVESMMILHAPEVKEKLEELGIPVFIDTSSRESHPMGRTEWIRLYGILTGHEQEAEKFFKTQKEQFAETEEYTDTGKSVAFFSISSSGYVVVRASGDYIAQMIELAGGHYILGNFVSEDNSSASVRLSMEEFYNTAKDADYLIYNATIEKPVGSVRELSGKFALLREFKAVQEGNVWQVKKSLYQSPDIAAQMIGDVHKMLVQEKGMTFLEKVGE